MAPPESLTENQREGNLALSFGLGKTNGALALFPFTTLFHEFDALETLHYRTFTSCAAFTFERVVLGHRIKEIGLRARKLGRSGELGKDEFACFLERANFLPGRGRFIQTSSSFYKVVTLSKWLKALTQR